MMEHTTPGEQTKPEPESNHIKRLLTEGHKDEMGAALMEFIIRLDQLDKVESEFGLKDHEIMLAFAKTVDEFVERLELTDVCKGYRTSTGKTVGIMPSLMSRFYTIYDEAADRLEKEAESDK